MMEYRIVEAINIEMLSRIVTTAIKNKWVPMGAPFRVKNAEQSIIFEYIWYQALIRDSEWAKQ